MSCSSRQPLKPPEGAESRPVILGNRARRCGGPLVVLADRNLGAQQDLASAARDQGSVHRLGGIGQIENATNG